MTLTLEVTGSLGEALGSQRRCVFSNAGGTIGRQPDNTWVLADAYVSSRHARVRYEDGSFYIEDDRSRNGVFVNSPDNRLPKGIAHELRHGDRIIIEPYEILADIAADVAVSPAGGANRFESVGEPFEPVPPGPLPAALSDDDPAPGPRGDDLLRMIGGSPAPAEVRDGRRARDLNPPIVNEHYLPPVVVRSPPVVVAPPVSQQPPPLPLPPDWDVDPGLARIQTPVEPERSKPNGPHFPAPLQQPRRPDDPNVAPGVPVSAPPLPRPDGRAAEGELADLLAAAGLSELPPTPELARNLGQILRVVVGGIMDALSARQQTKSEFRVEETRFQRAGDNSPFKFSLDVDDALRKLLADDNPAFLKPVEAFEDAFDDIGNHQMATLEGMRAAFDAMFAMFAPERLEQEFDGQLKKGMMPAKLAKMKYWDLYSEWIHDMVRDADGSFRTLFGDEFARAYEEQLSRLKSPRRSGRLAKRDSLER